jgi:translocator protein
MFTIEAIPAWYSSLNKPSFTPPDWLFGPVWIILYLLMGVSLFIIWKEELKNKEVRTAFLIFILQLIFNAVWSIIFFGAHSIAGGLVVIVILWILILVTILKFMKISRIAGILLIPYLLWVSFAMVLNFSIFNLN